MDVESTGTLVKIESTANSGSQSITVPADAEIMILGIQGSPADGLISEGSFTIGGSGLSLVIENYDVLINRAIYSKSSPSTGSQTFAWDLLDENDNPGIVYYIRFYKVVSGTGSTAAGEVVLEDSINTGEMTAASGDAVFAMAYGYWDPLPDGIAWTNATELDDSEYGILRNSCAEAILSGNVTITATPTITTPGEMFVGIIAVVIQKSGEVTYTPHFLSMLGVGG